MKDTFDIEAGIEALHDSSRNACFHLFVSSLNSKSMINKERSEIWRDKNEWGPSLVAKWKVPTPVATLIKGKSAGRVFSSGL